MASLGSAAAVTRIAGFLCMFMASAVHVSQLEQKKLEEMLMDSSPMTSNQSSKETVDLHELEFLCAVGIPWACKALRVKGELMQRSLELVSEQDLHRDMGTDLMQCPPEGRLIFQHVMKTGGLSIDDFFQCHCQNGNCGILHDDGGHYRKRTKCRKPSICTTHGAYQSLLEPNVCGPSFAQAKVFTILRDPVERVWSFYTYLRRKYKPFQERTLHSILSHYGEEDLNEGLPVEERCAYCLSQLSNFMVLGNFCGLSNASKCYQLQGKRLPTFTLKRALEKSIDVITKLDGIFLFDSIGSFPTLFRNASHHLIYNRTQREAKKAEKAWPTFAECDMAVANPTHADVTLDKKTVELITDLNSADIELYNVASRLPHIFS